jgi:soluble lytic murein transglycosylase
MKLFNFLSTGKTLQIFLQLFLLFCGLDNVQIYAQDLPSKIRTALENREYQTAVLELQNLEKSDKKVFTINNYDYLLARLAEKREDFALAMANYQTVVKRNSVLSEYALWHLAQLSRSTGNLIQERVYLNELLTIAPNSLVKEAATARVARSYFESKDFARAIAFLQNTVITSPASTNTVLPTLTAPNPAIFGKLTGNDAKTRENLVLLGKSYLQSGKLNEAREVFTRLVNNLPNSSQPDDFALAGAQGLDDLDGGKDNFGKVAPNIPDFEHLRRALIYQFNRNFLLARMHYKAIVEQSPQSGNVPDALYQIGRGYVLELAYNEAITWFERVQAQFPDHPVSKDALSQAASCYARVNKPKEAISRYQKFIEKYADADNLERAYLNIVDIERDLGEESDAIKWTTKTRETFKGKLPEAIALFTQVRIRIAQNDWTGALTDLNELQNASDFGGTRVPGGTNKTEIAFLKAFVLEQLQRFPEAIDLYLSIPDGRAEYYGGRATERLRALAANDPSGQAVSQKLNFYRYFLASASPNITVPTAENIRQAAQAAFRLTTDTNVQNQLLDVVRRAYAVLPAYQKIPNGKLMEVGRKEVLKEERTPTTNYHQTLADELLFLGLYDEGTPELEISQSSMINGQADEQSSPSKIQNSKSEIGYTLAVFYKRGEMAHRATLYAEPLWKNVPNDYQIELIPRDQIELLYPAPYTDALIKFAPPRNVDPRFALSIMRQESRYRADIKSYAAARGLMQFISDTADKIAGELGKKDFRQDELYNPPTAILFGSQYLSNLYKQFPNHHQAVAASYNGGEHNMVRWLARSKTDLPDRYVSEIIFAQSKDYVYKVMANYRIYQMFYDEKLKAR